jgi:glucose-6-phosphate isomerase
MGGSSLAPEVITRTNGIALTVLDSTDPDQVRRAIGQQIAATAVIVSSKSGGTVETDSQKRIYEKAFRDAGIDPLERIVVVTDPDSPLDVAARADGYRVFNADPTVGGRYSALTAFGIVPSGLAGVDIESLLREAEAMSISLAVDEPDNPGLILGAAIAGTRPLKNKLGIVTDGTHIVGFGDWIEQLIAESTGKDGKGILPVVLSARAPELELALDDVQIVRLVGDYEATKSVRDGDIEITGSLGALVMTWEYATVIAGRLLGINPFDQPDVESAKIAARGMLEQRDAVIPAQFENSGIEVRSTSLELGSASTIAEAIKTLLAQVSDDDGYLSVQAYLDRTSVPEAAELRDLFAKATRRPVTFGWAPRFLHSTGQYHKGGPRQGVFLQIVAKASQDIQVPGRDFSFGELIASQAAGDAKVLGALDRPVLTLTLGEAKAGLEAIKNAIA